MKPSHSLEYATPTLRKPPSPLDVAIVMVMVVCALWIVLMGVVVGVMIFQRPHETRSLTLGEYAALFLMMWMLLSSPATILLVASWLLRRWRRHRIQRSDSSQPRS
jgi:DMSO/TMAO reductase YedYZ heme-binding membrane subunit